MYPSPPCPGMKERTVSDQRIFQIPCHDRMASGIRLRARAHHRADAENPSVRHHVRPQPQQYAAVEAMKHCDEDVAQMREQYNARRRYLMHRFEEMGLKCFEPFGAFYMFPSIKEFDMTSGGVCHGVPAAQEGGGGSGDSFRGLRRGISADLLRLLSGGSEGGAGPAGRIVNELRAEKKCQG